MRPKILILGGGFGGAYCAQALADKLGSRQAEIRLLDPNNFFVFYPFLIEAGTGSLAPSHAVVSIRSFLKDAAFSMTRVVGADLDSKQVFCRRDGSTVDETFDYDHLVIALGSVTRMLPVPGLTEYGFGIKNLADAIALRDRAIRMLERANDITDPQQRRDLLSFVVVGGNFTGVEVAGEFHTFLRQASRRYPNLDPDDCRVTLIEIADRILPALDEELSRYAVRKMRDRGVEVRLESSVTAVAADKVTLATGADLPCGTLIWCAGISPHPVLRELDLPTDDLGYVLCDPNLRVSGRENVWAIGDCAVNPDRNGKPYPATAQHATRQGKHLADNLVRVLNAKDILPFDYDSRGSLVGIGCRTGVAKVFGIKLSGFAAWFLWRTFYLLMLPGWSRKMRVALDWTMDLLFTRDYVQLGVLRNRNDPPADRPGA